MSIEGFFVREVTIIRPAYIENRTHDVVADWAESTSTTVKGWLARLSESENHDNRDAELATWVVRLPKGTDIVAGDRVSIDAQVFEVDGPPNTAWTPRGAHHMRVPLRTVRG